MKRPVTVIFLEIIAQIMLITCFQDIHDISVSYIREYSVELLTAAVALNSSIPIISGSFDGLLYCMFLKKRIQIY